MARIEDWLSVYLSWVLENLVIWSLVISIVIPILKSLWIYNQVRRDPWHHFQSLRSKLWKWDFLAYKSAKFSWSCLVYITIYF